MSPRPSDAFGLTGGCAAVREGDLRQAPTGSVPLLAARRSLRALGRELRVSHVAVRRVLTNGLRRGCDTGSRQEATDGRALRGRLIETQTIIGLDPRDEGSEDSQGSFGH